MVPGDISLFLMKTSNPNEIDILPVATVANRFKKYAALFKKQNHGTQDSHVVPHHGTN